MPWKGDTLGHGWQKEKSKETNIKYKTKNKKKFRGLDLLFTKDNLQSNEKK